MDIRKAIKESGLRHWQVADRIGMSEFTFSRKLRNPSAEFIQQVEDVLKGGGNE